MNLLKDAHYIYLLEQFVYIGDVLEVREELVTALIKYKKVILNEKMSTLHASESNQDTLLHFDVVDAKPFTINDSQDAQQPSKSSMDVLCDIFTATNIPDNGDVLQPIHVVKNGKYFSKNYRNYYVNVW